MNNKTLYYIIGGLLITVAILFYFAVKNEPKSLSEIELKQQQVNNSLDSINTQLEQLSKNILQIQQNEKDTIKYYYTTDRTIVNLDRYEQSSLFSDNTKELIEKERNGYFD